MQVAWGILIIFCVVMIVVLDQLFPKKWSDFMFLFAFSSMVGV